jgi:hypothetical protein
MYKIYVKYFNNKLMEERNILERRIEGCKGEETKGNKYEKDEEK